jgi:hypothetical protein
MRLNRRSPEVCGPPPSANQDRRTVCRYSVVLSDAWVGWWQDEAFQTTPAKIIDISLRGAKLHVGAYPPQDQMVWFCPPGVTAQEDWIEVKVVGMKKRLFGPRELRVAFRKVFPYEVFKSVVYGPDAFKAVQVPTWVPEESDERDWW